MSGGDRGAGRGVLLAVVVHLDDLDVGEELAGNLGELHHEDGAGGEVRGKEELAALVRVLQSEGLHVLTGNTGGAHNGVRTMGQHALDIGKHGTRLGEVDHDVGSGGVNERTQIIGAGKITVGAGNDLPSAMGIEAADKLEVLSCGHSVDDAGAHTTLGARNDNLNHKVPP